MSKIVVVDDSKLMRNLIQHILEQAGHEVDAWAEVTAMEVADRILASDPDLVVTDYQMPGCNGLTLARMARKAKPGLPIEVIQEFDNWRRIRDSEGSEGWVLHSLLSGRRTALVAPWRKNEEFPLRATASADAPIKARLQSGVIGTLKSCTGTWCRLAGEGFDGWIEQQSVWGAYPGEKLE